MATQNSRDTVTAGAKFLAFLYTVEYVDSTNSAKLLRYSKDIKESKTQDESILNPKSFVKT